MKDKILEILQGVEIANANKHYEPPDKRQKISARLIADMVQKFVECITWDYLTFERGKVRYWRDSNDNEYTFDKLFTYWHKNIYNIKDKKG